MKKLLSILTVLVIGIFFLSGIVVAVVTINKDTTKNHPPYAPNIDGPRFVKPKTVYNWTFKAIDPDGDNISYKIDWGDGTSEEWTEWFSSGEEITQSHTYPKYGDAAIRAKAKDIHGAEGPEGTFPIEVMHRIKTINTIFFQSIGQFIKLYFYS